VLLELSQPAELRVVCVCVRERDREQGFWVKEQQRKEQESY